jgi:hypothetical protein
MGLSYYSFKYFVYIIKQHAQNEYSKSVGYIFLE